MRYLKSSIAILILALVLFTHINNAYSMPRFTLEDAIEKAIENSPEIKLLDFKIERTMLEIKESTFDKKNTELVEKQSKQKIMVLENQKSDVIDEITYEVSEKYYNIIILEKTLTFVNKDYRYTKSELDNAEINYDTGLLDSLSLEKIKEKLRTKEEAISNTEGDLKRAKVSLLLSMGENLNSNVKISNDISLDTSSTDLSSSEGKLYSNNRSILLAKLNLEVKELEYDALVRISASKDSIKKASLDVEEATIVLEQTKKEMYKELANKYLDVEKYLQELETNETRLNYQQEKFRLNKRKYNEGLITQIELNSIELDMDSAELNYLNSIAKVNLAKLLFRMMLA